jgi:hypothetical protein
MMEVAPILDLYKGKEIQNVSGRSYLTILGIHFLLDCCCAIWIQYHFTKQEDWKSEENAKKDFFGKIVSQMLLNITRL